MARIRTIKPEFWEDEAIALLSMEARLLFIGTFNLADDEGLLRWNGPYLKASIFIYDDHIATEHVESMMDELVTQGMIFPYTGGKTQQKLAYVVAFHRHQKINRPSLSKLPPPNIQNDRIRYMYGRRDRMICHLCNEQINLQPQTWDALNLSIDHLRPRSAGGSDYPSNLAASHQSCNKSRGTKDVPATSVFAEYVNDSLNDSVNDSLPEGEREVEGKGNRKGSFFGEDEKFASEVFDEIARRRLRARLAAAPGITQPSRWLTKVANSERRERSDRLAELMQAHPGTSVSRMADYMEGLAPVAQFTVVDDTPHVGAEGARRISALKEQLR